ncbi:hypothetical protein CTI12_AA442730 [Artemisia annua]|uniref:RRM domain-containing protein n=1 Tax=Artemisia annua TaxID=35608 RepID=A0A2U1LY80_ARTAN|nr:hypothetical protein CTI12_AA442730 [Artemisia annua]
MPGVSSFNSKPDGWTWVFRKNNSQHTKPINNPFAKDMERIATSYFVTNFPESLDAKGLWKQFQPFGRIVDAFIANKRSKNGKRFGFIRFLGIRNEGEFAKVLSNIWMGSYHVYVSIARFQRQSKYNNNAVKKESTGFKHSPHAAHVRPSYSTNVPSSFNAKQTYVSVANGDVALKRAENNGENDKVNCIQLFDDDLIKVEDTSTVVLVKVKEVDSLSNMYRICRNEGFVDVKIHYVGGLWVWIQFNNEKACQAFKSNVSLKKLWSALKVVSPSFKVDERMVWVEIHGLPLCAWGSNAFKKVVSMFGSFKFFDLDVEDIMSMGRICIATKQQSLISEWVNVLIHGENFNVHIKEVGTWSTHITNDLDVTDSDDDSRSLNEDENQNDVLDEFIQQVVAEEKSSNSTNEVNHVKKVGECFESESAGSKPPGFEHVNKVEENSLMDSVKNVQEVNPKETEVKNVDSDATIPPGFENLFRGDKDASCSPSKSRTSKCSTSFGNHKKKGMKGFSFIDEMNRMIEVGGALGYDVKGCKRSLKRMINGIGVSMVDK